MTDIVERLRKRRIFDAQLHPALMDDLADAADEIERLRAALADECAAHRVCVEMRDIANAEIERLRADDMRTCAAFLDAIEISEILTDEKMEAIIDARKLLIEAAETIEKLTEQPMRAIGMSAAERHVRERIATADSGMAAPLPDDFKMVIKIGVLYGLLRDLDALRKVEARHD